MKKILLGSTAVAAAALIAGSASAQDVTSGGGLAITGWVGSQAVLTFNNDEADDRDYDFVTDARIQFDWTSTTDSGLTYGARVRLEVDNAGEDDDIYVSDSNMYVFVSGGFGTVKMGDVGNASGEWYNYYVHDSKSLGGSFAIGAEDSWTVQATGASPGVVYVDPYAGSGIYYRSPDIGGFAFALSYQPEGGEVGDILDFSNGPDDVTNIIAGSAQYNAQFDGGSFFVGGSALYGDVEDADDDYYFNWGIGAGGTFGPVDVGVWYTADETNSYSGNTLWVSGSYSFGAFTAIASAAFSDFEDDYWDEEWDGSIYVATLTYQVAPGLNAFAEIAYTESSGDDGGDDWDADGAALGAGLVFGF